jgi:arylsulfatase A-like enzyme
LFVGASVALFVLVLVLANFTGEISERGELRKAQRARAAVRAQKKEQDGPGDAFLTFGPDVSRADPPAGAPNLVFVLASGLRRDHVTPYGGAPELTPRLAALAAQGARFGDAVSAAPFSGTAAVAWLTGRHALTLGMVDPSPRQVDPVLPDEIETFPERLRAAGWVTLGVTSNPNLNSSSGLAQGFDRYRDTERQGFSPKLRLAGADVVSHALSMLDDRTVTERERPFYLQVAFIETHHPYAPAPGATSDYVAAVQRTDTLVGTLLDGLEERSYDRASNTVVVVLADHGTGLEQPEHHGKWHGRLLYPTSVAWPWIVAGPGVPHGRVVSGLASHTDVPSTLLDLLGLPGLPPEVDGRSWADAVRGRTDRTTRTRAISDTWYFTANRSSIWTDERQCQKDFGSARLEHDGFQDGCYDRMHDPEFRTVFQDDALMAELVGWRERNTPSREAATP